jgi:hypothetical protein
MPADRTPPNDLERYAQDLNDFVGRVQDRAHRATDQQPHELRELHLGTLPELADDLRAIMDEEDTTDDELKKASVDYAVEVLMAVDPSNPADDELRYAAIELAREAVEGE